MVEECKKNGITVIISHIKDQPLRAMQKVGLIEKIGEENFCSNIDDAIEKAEKIILENNLKKKEIAEEKKKKTDATQEEMRKKFDELTEEWRKKAIALYEEKHKLIKEKINDIKAKDNIQKNKKEDDK
jgi:hypothetical protein